MPESSEGGLFWAGVTPALFFLLELGGASEVCAASLLGPVDPALK